MVHGSGHKTRGVIRCRYEIFISSKNQRTQTQSRLSPKVLYFGPIELDSEIQNDILVVDEVLIVCKDDPTEKKKGKSNTQKHTNRDRRPIKSPFNCFRRNPDYSSMWNLKTI